MPDPTPLRLPLSALLSQTLVAFTREFEQGVAAAGHPELSLALGSNVLRFLDVGEGIRVGELADRAGVTKQAISQQLAYLERHGQIALEVDPDDRRAKLIRLTPLGKATRDVCRPLFGTVEDAWRARHGSDAVDRLRDALEAIVADFDRELPHYPG